MKKLKLIWDFHGPDAKGIAQHHEIHLKEYGEANELVCTTGVDQKNEVFWSAWIIVSEENMPQVRDALKPQRGEYA